MTRYRYYSLSSSLLIQRHCYINGPCTLRYGLPTAGNASVVIVGNGYGNLPTTYIQHFSLGTDYQFGKNIVASIGYQGSLGRHLINHMNPNAAGVVGGWTLNPLVTGGDFWLNSGISSNNAMLVEVKHPFAHHFQADAQFQWAKSLDTNASGPYNEDPYYPLLPAYSYGPSDFNVGKSFKIFGLWQPVFFHGGHSWMEKVGVRDWPGPADPVGRRSDLAQGGRAGTCRSHSASS